MCLFKGLKGLELEELLPTLMLPTTALLATATAGSSVVNFTGLSVGLSMPVLIVSYMLLGAGEFLLSFPLNFTPSSNHLRTSLFLSLSTSRSCPIDLFI